MTAAAPGDAAPQENKRTAQGLFVKNFKVYANAVVELNVLGHNELYAAACEYLLHKMPGELRLLDLGCGDARNICVYFHQHGMLARLGSYTGVDSSGQALDTARQHLGDSLPAGCAVQLVEQDALSFLQADAGEYDLLMAVFVVHHLSTEEKAAALGEYARMCRAAAAAGRAPPPFVMVDVVLLDGIDRDAWLERADRHLRSSLGHLEEERAAVWSHVHACDLPESPEWWAATAASCGLTARVLTRCPYGLSAAIVFEHA